MIKLLIGGSPCTHWSIAQSKNRETKADGVGWELFKNYDIARQKFQPDFFLYENNWSASKEIKAQIQEVLGCELMRINSRLVSAQNRDRFYVFNWDVNQPEDRGILLGDILEELPEPFKTVRYEVCDGQTIMSTKDRMRQANKRGSRQGTYVYFPNADKSNTLLAAHAKDEMVILPISPSVIQKYGCEIENSYEVSNGFINIFGELYKVNLLDGYWYIRHLTLTECKRLQTIPDKYKFPVCDTQAYKAIGNGWTAEVIIHILNGALQNIPRDEKIVVLSMYDGIATGRYCLDKMGFKNIEYHAYEIDKYAIQIAMSNYPDIIQHGDAFDVRKNDWHL